MIMCRPKSEAEKVKNDLEQSSDWIVISVLDPEKPRIFYSDNTLTLWFHDTEEEYEFNTVLFTEEMAQKVKSFVDKHIGKNIFIHCTMGKCRSCAIGETLAEYLGINYFDFKRINPQSQPNILVKTIMQNILN